MSFQHESLRCADCDLPFVFTATGQDIFASEGLHRDAERCQ